jgi:hypothetical protein
MKRVYATKGTRISSVSLKTQSTNDNHQRIRSKRKDIALVDITNKCDTKEKCPKPISPALVLMPDDDLLELSPIPPCTQPLYSSISFASPCNQRGDRNSNKDLLITDHTPRARSRIHSGPSIDFSSKTPHDIVWVKNVPVLSPTPFHKDILNLTLSKNNAH